MKNFTYKALAVATIAACGSSAHAGYGASAAPKYAVEGVAATTAVNLSPIYYSMGVSRQTTQPFTIIVRVPQGSAQTLTCGTAPTTGGGALNATTGVASGSAAGAFTVTVKRASSTECAYDVNVTTTLAVNDVINFAGVQLSNHSLTTAGDSELLNIALYDTGESARVDNSVDKQVTVATSGRAVSLTATADTHTTADVNFNSGNNPLFGFVAGGTGTSTTADLANTTYANFSLAIDSTNFVNAAGSAVNAANLLSNVVVTISGDFTGVKTTFGGTGNSAVTTSVGATSAVTGSASSAVFSISGANMHPTATTTFQVALVTAQTVSLGTSRTFGVSAVVNPSLNGAAAQTLAGNASWWTWKANAIQLQSAFFNNDTTNGNLTRFFFQNLGTAANYSAQCYGETGVTPTSGSAISGTLAAGTTAINASDICTFSTGKRGSIVFTINSASSKVKGVYQQAINGAAAAYIPLERPYGSSTAN